MESLLLVAAAAAICGRIAWELEQRRRKSRIGGSSARETESRLMEILPQWREKHMPNVTTSYHADASCEAFPENWTRSEVTFRCSRGTSFYEILAACKRIELLNNAGRDHHMRLMGEWRIGLDPDNKEGWTLALRTYTRVSQVEEKYYVNA